MGNSRIILGIDPGSRHTGFALLSVEERTFRALVCDTIHTDHLEDHTDRLQVIFEEVSRIIDAWHPDECAVETPIYGIDPLAMLKLGRAQAAAILAVTNQGLSVSEYYPKAVKKAITGNGNASKKQVAYMLRKLVEFPDNPISEDATDALSVAWCHYSGSGPLSGSSQSKKSHQNNSKSSWKAFIADNPDRVRNP
ncbi:MAG: crossover junction endodeoxyribonuclease RuvC [Balneolaceae bacterium]